MPFSSTHNHQYELQIKTEIRSVLGWPSNTFSIDFSRTLPTTSPDEESSVVSNHPPRNDVPGVVAAAVVVPPHTVLVFVPGNPGLIEWYIPSFADIVGRLGPGFAARGVSNAGHGVSEAELEAYSDGTISTTFIPWTIDGQVLHKSAYMDLLEDDFRQLSSISGDNNNGSATNQELVMPRYIFVSHSIGAHFTQRLCMLRPDLLMRQRILLLLHVTPFVCMKVPYGIKQVIFDFAASHPVATISIHERLMRFLRWLPETVVAACVLVDATMLLKTQDAAASSATTTSSAIAAATASVDVRKVTTQLLRQPAFATNFFKLGSEEIRDVPETIDVSK